MRPVVRAIDFVASSANDPLAEVLDFLQAAFRQQGSLSQFSTDALPGRWIPENAKRYLYAPGKEGEKQLQPDRYEFLVYRLVRNKLEAGGLFCWDSVRFRSFDDDLLDDEQWQQKEVLLDSIGLSLLKKRPKNT